MFYRIALLSLCTLLCLSGCSNDKKAKEQATLDAALHQHCQNTVKLSLAAYIQKYTLHNGNTEKDRQDAIKDYQACKKQIEG